MTTRWPWLVGALTLALSVPTAAVATAPAGRAVTADPGPRPQAARAAGQALSELRADADEPVRVRRDASGEVRFVGSVDGAALLDGGARAGARATAASVLDEYGAVFGLDGESSRAVVGRTLPGAGGATVVRADQVVDGVPVFGGQLVLSLDDRNDLVSVAAATTEPLAVPAPVVTEATARQVALRLAARTHRVPLGALTVRSLGRRVFDPTIVHVSDPAGVRPVWQLEVTNGSDVRETVLVGTTRGEVALHFNDAPDLRRRVCDNVNLAISDARTPVPICTLAARTEGGLVTGNADVDQAYTNLGRTAQAYTDLDAIDLTQLIGTTVGGAKTLQATVRWCFSDSACPYRNAFWDGAQMVFGQGFAAPDDVVAHELTHGFVEHTAGLFYFHQSGAVNESLADTLGEIVDHRNGADDDTAWTIGEDLPGIGAIRSMKDPTLFGQPDRMTSSRFVSADVWYDNGAIHDNDGVGNKTAHLISQGGTFNGRTVTGIDGGDPGLTKTGRLYLETIPRLTSGAEFADLALALETTCDQLAAAGTTGFSAGDCASVRTATAATELAAAPVDPEAAAPEVAASCPTGHEYAELARDDDAHTDQLGWTFGSLWQRTPANGTPAYAAEGTSSLFAWNPDPTLGDPARSDLTGKAFGVPTGKRTYLHFRHAHLMDWTPEDDGVPLTYHDGGQALVQVLDSSTGTWVTRTGLPWVNGPTRTLASDPAPGWAGDSRGYGSSRVDLTSLAGQTARIVLRVVGDTEGSLLGWWVDDVRLFGCTPHEPTAPRSLTAASTRTGSTLTWAAPAAVPGGLQHYLVTRNGAAAGTTTGRSFGLTKPAGTGPVTLAVRAQDRDGRTSPAVALTLTSTTTRSTLTTSKVKGKLYVDVRGTVRGAGSGTAVRSMPVQLLRSYKATDPWRVVGQGTTGTTGTKSWRLLQTKSARYQVVALGRSTLFGSAGAVTRVAMR